MISGAGHLRHSGATAMLDLPSQIDQTAEAALSGGYAEAAARGAKTLVLNFSGVEFLSSTGIALIVEILARARADGRAIAAVGLSDHYREIFEITRLVDFMTIYQDENAALKEEQR